MDIGRRYPRGYIHCHKLHHRPEGFGQEGPSEMHYLLNLLHSKVSGSSNEHATFEAKTPSVGEKTHINKVIYKNPLHGCADIH